MIGKAKMIQLRKEIISLSGRGPFSIGLGLTIEGDVIF